MKWTLIVIFGSSLVETALSWTYHYSNKTMTWTQARQWCQTHFTDMVIIQSQEENDFLVSKLPNRTKSPYYWIGITKKHLNEAWTWIGNNSTWIGEHSWAPNEPNNNHSTEFCVEIYVNTGEKRGKWNDEKCGSRKFPVCYQAQCNSTICGRGRCQETIDSAVCQCEPGFKGDRCQTAIACPAPETATHVQISCLPPLLSPVSDVTLHAVGMVCNFTCDEGHELQGAFTIECAHSGQWTSTPPNCTAVPPPITAIAVGVAAGGALLLSGFALAIWTLTKQEQKAINFELNSNSDTSQHITLTAFWAI